MSGCVEPESAPSNADQAPDAAADATREAEAATARRVPLAQFRGTVDLDNEAFSLEMIDPSEWAADAVSLRGDLRDVEQAVWCPVRVTQGRPDTVGLRTEAGSIGFSTSACGVAASFPFDTLGVFCFDATLENYYGTTLINPLAELTKISPDSGYTAYNFSSSSGLFGVDVSTLRGPLPPSDILGGPFGWDGNLAPGETKTVQWGFQNEGGVFSFEGAIVAEIAEICGNGIDDNCDGIVDDGCGTFTGGSSCFVDADCDTGFCGGATSAVPGVCQIGGCTDLQANNYDPAAEGDDGSCLYDIDFEVNMNCSDVQPGPGESVFVQGEWTDWAFAAAQLTDPDGDGIWTGTVESGLDTFEWKISIGASDWSTGGWGSDEDLTGASCAVDNGSGFFNREITVTGDATETAIYGGCGRCLVIEPSGDASVTVAGNIGNQAPFLATVGETVAFFGGENAAHVLPFQLPALAAGETIGSARLRVALFESVGPAPGMPVGLDLYAIDVRPVGAPVAADFYAGPLDAGSTLVRDDFVPAGTTFTFDPGNLLYFSADDAALATFLQDNWQSGQFATLRISPSDDLSTYGGDNVIRVLSGGAGVSAERPQLYVETELSGTPGCVDPAANNFDPAAGFDDGSCLYNVTFCVDMGCPDQSGGSAGFTTVGLTGPSLGWCGDCAPLTETTPGLYCNTLELPAGPFEYKYITDGFADQEDLIDDAQQGRACAPVTDANTFANREHVVGATTTVNDTYGTCGSCPQGTNLDVLPSADDGRVHTAGGTFVDNLSATVTSVGEFFSPGGANYIAPFPLPGRDVGGEVFAAELEIYIANVHGTPVAPFNVDLYGRVASGGAPFVDWGTGDYFQGASDTGGAWTLIEDDFLNSTDDWSAGRSFTSPAGTAALGALLEAAYDAGAVEGDYLLLRFSPDADPIPAGYNAWDIYTSEAGVNGPRLHIDHTGLSYAVTPVPGCTDASANNFDAGATQNDGSCTYDVTIVVDTTCPDHLLPGTVADEYAISSSLWGWDPNAIVGNLADQGDGTAAVTLSVPAGVFTFTIYAYADDGLGGRTFVDKEDLIDNMQGGATCAPSTDFFAYANREETIAGPTTLNLVYGECGTTCPGPDLSASYDIVATEDDMIHNRYGSGNQVGDPGLPERAVVGEYYGQASVYVMSFLMPDLADDEYITGVSLRLDIAGQNDNDGVAGYPFAGDLWGLPYAMSGTLTVGDHFFLGANDPNGTLAADDLFTTNSEPDPFTTSATGIVDYLNEQRGDGAEGNYVFLRINPDVAPIPPGWNNWEFWRNGAAGSLPPQLTVETDRCAPGAFVDCSGNCVVGDPVAASGDAVCDNGITGINLNCSLFGFDGGDCTGLCNPGEILACDGVSCVNDTTANGTCDAALNCTDQAYDGLDCLNVSQGACGAGEVANCQGGCTAVSTLTAAFGDGICQPAEDCAALAFGGGDCCSGATIVDCDGNTVCDDSVVAGNGVCESIRGGGLGNLLCAAQSYEGGDCQGPCAGSEIPTCSLFGSAPWSTYGCQDAETAMASIGNGVCDATFACGYYAQDGGDCANPAQAACYGNGQLADCDDACFSYAGLNFWGDAACDDGGFGPPNFECADWSFDYDPFADPGQTGSADCQVNLLTNPGFESGLTGWATFPGAAFVGTQDTGTTFFGSANTFTALAGNTSGKIYSDPGLTEANLYQEFNGVFPEGQSYQLSGQVFLAAEEPFAGTNSVVAGFKFFTGGYGFLGWPQINVADGSMPTNTWAPFSVCGTVPAGAQIVQAGVAYIGNNQFGTAWFDEMVLEPVASCPSPVNVEVNNRTEAATNYDVLQVTGAEAGATPGGTATADLRTIYAHVPDAGGDPSYTGAAWPYVVIPDGATQSATGAVSASVSNRYVSGVGRVLTINGTPAYQYTGDTDPTGMTGAFVATGTWHAFTPAGTEVTGTPQVFGCTDGDANNFNPAATDEDGSCQYDVTLNVDMSCYQAPGAYLDNLGPISFVNISGPGNGWCPDCMQLSDPDGDNIWSGTFSFAPTASWEYTLQHSFWTGKENIIGDGACAAVTDGFNYANRTLTVTDAPQTIDIVYGTCAAACPTYAVNWCNVQFPTSINNNAGAVETVYGQLYVPGLTDASINQSQRPDNVVAEFGWGAPGADASGYTFEAASDNALAGNNYEFQVDWTLPGAGTYDYVFRMSGDDGASWSYCGPGGVDASPVTVSRGDATVN